MSSVRPSPRTIVLAACFEWGTATADLISKRSAVVVSARQAAVYLLNEYGYSRPIAMRVLGRDAEALASDLFDAQARAGRDATYADRLQSIRLRIAKGMQIPPPDPKIIRRVNDGLNCEELRRLWARGKGWSRAGLMKRYAISPAELDAVIGPKVVAA